jgi:predicted short-subunit dehydrogenase-like oxidoreductase (DUF2520 family)
LRAGFVGAGVVGTVLALALSDRGYEIVAVASRTPASAEALARRLPACAVETPQGVADRAELVFLTTPDDAIGAVARAIRWRPGQRVVHCSGAASTAVLEPARKMGCLVGGFHPLQTFATAETSLAKLPGTTFAIEADEPLASELCDLAVALWGRPLRLRAEDKVLYHAAASIASNYLVVLVGLAADLWAELGVEQSEAIGALSPLLEGTLANVERVGLPGALTGPIARGDVGTVRRHLDALARRAPGAIPAYALLGREAMRLAVDKGTLDRDSANALATLFDQAEGKGTEGGQACA